MLHLHEEHEPQPFPPPRGLQLEPICSTTGLHPDASCSSVVYEYLYPQDMAAYLETQSRQTLPREYDEWVARQDGEHAPTRPRILFPHDGDAFVLYPNQGGFSPEAQAIELRAMAPPGEQLVFWLNGSHVASQPSGIAFWPLRRGTWTLRVQSKHESDSVTFDVVAGTTRVLRRGFSLVQR